MFVSSQLLPTIKMSTNSSLEFSGNNMLPLFLKSVFVEYCASKIKIFS